MMPLGSEGGFHVTIVPMILSISTTPGANNEMGQMQFQLSKLTLSPAWSVVADNSLLGSLVPTPLVAVMVTPTV